MHPELERLSEAELTPVHRLVIAGLDRILGALPPGRATVVVRSDEDSPSLLKIVEIIPTNYRAARLLVHLTTDGPGARVNVSFGEHGRIDIEDHFNKNHPMADADVVTRFTELIQAVIGGGLTETLYHRRGRLYKCRFVLEGGPSPVTLDRVNVRRWIQTLGSRRSVQTVVYAAY